MELVLKDIHKSFGEKQVLKDVNITAQSGGALGLLGRNGAGKTTTIRIIMGLFPADNGSVTIDGEPVARSKAKIGYLPEERGLYLKIPIREQLTYLGELRGMKHKDAADAALKWVKRLDMEEYIDKKLETLSKGNQQKIQLGATMLNDPDIIILDEPFSGLDPVNAQLLKDIVREQVAAGKVVVFSSHQMPYVEEFCDNIAIINQGNIVLSGSLRAIKRSYDRTRIQVVFDPSVERPADTVRGLIEQGGVKESIKSVQTVDDGCIVNLVDPADKTALFGALSASGLGIDRFEVLEPTLEEIFVEKAGEAI